MFSQKLLVNLLVNMLTCLVNMMHGNYFFLEIHKQSFLQENKFQEKIDPPDISKGKENSNKTGRDLLERKFYEKLLNDVAEMKITGKYKMLRFQLEVEIQFHTKVCYVIGPF